MNTSPDFDAKAQLTACRSTHKHAMRLFPPVWTQKIFKENSNNGLEYRHMARGNKTKHHKRIEQIVIWNFTANSQRQAMLSMVSLPRIPTCEGTQKNLTKKPRSEMRMARRAILYIKGTKDCIKFS